MEVFVVDPLKGVPPVGDWLLVELFPVLALLVEEDELALLFACYVVLLEIDYELELEVVWVDDEEFDELATFELFA